MTSACGQRKIYNERNYVACLTLTAWRRLRCSSHSLLVEPESRYVMYGRGRLLGLRLFLPHLPRCSRRRGFFVCRSSPAIIKEQPPGGGAQTPGGPLRARALGRRDTRNTDGIRIQHGSKWMLSSSGQKCDVIEDSSASWNCRSGRL
jgi:hypothetical protein